MQSRDEAQRIVQSTQVDMDAVDDLLSKMKSAEEKGAVSHTIGKLPKSGQTVEINGLKYRVAFADYVKGQYNVKLTLK